MCQQHFSILPDALLLIRHILAGPVLPFPHPLGSPDLQSTSASIIVQLRPSFLSAPKAYTSVSVQQCSLHFTMPVHLTLNMLHSEQSIARQKSVNDSSSPIRHERVVPWKRRRVFAPGIPVRRSTASLQSNFVRRKWRKGLALTGNDQSNQRVPWNRIFCIPGCPLEER